VLADVVHSTRLCLFCVGELVNPDRLRHVVPPGSSSTVAHAQTRKHLTGGTDVPGWQPGRDFEAQVPSVWTEDDCARRVDGRPKRQ
jgi:hypothetical protein